LKLADWLSEDVTANAPIKYAELLCHWLKEFGYTHCFFVAGGAAMHLLDGARKNFVCVPFVHEVAAGIAVEYFNESDREGRAFALVTAGPGLTNIVTALASAWLESRELLVIGGQVKSVDLADRGIRQRGIQEIDGRSLVGSITCASERLTVPWSRSKLLGAVATGRSGRAGPVFIEICLDVQGAPVDPSSYNDGNALPETGASADAIARAKEGVREVIDRLRTSERPLILFGGGISRKTAAETLGALRDLAIPVMTTWNAADRIRYDEALYVGRPNTWGERSANVLLRQADCIVALGTRLGIQQTGFNWQEFGRDATIVQVDLDRSELDKGHPRVAVKIEGDANTFLRELVAYRRDELGDYSEWLQFARHVRSVLPLNESANETAPGFISPYIFYQQLSRLSNANDNLIPCSSGGANFTAMQVIEQTGQTIITDKGLASMGIGLSGAIGIALADRNRRTLVVEGDGGFIQNLQELATVAVNRLNIKIFIFANDGYASIRSSQKNYFGGAYLGCDIASGLGFPDWEPLFRAFGIPVMTLDESGLDTPAAREALKGESPHGFIVPIDPEQTYFPKITSRITESGSMESNPIHLMTPELAPEIAESVFRFIEARTLV
jgi:acetolactate synthase-1/2/3 large subunit